MDNVSALAGLMGRCVAMVNLLWAVHLAVLAQAPGVPAAHPGDRARLHWVVFGWLVGHPLGLLHAIGRTLLVTGAWWLVPDHRISAVAAAVVASYAYALYALTTRPLTEASTTPSPAGR